LKVNSFDAWQTFLLARFTVPLQLIKRGVFFSEYNPEGLLPCRLALRLSEFIKLMAFSFDVPYQRCHKKRTAQRLADFREEMN